MRSGRHLFLRWALFLAMGNASAQPVYVTYHSLELRVVLAQSIVHGTITNLTRTVLVPPNGYRTNFSLVDGALKPSTLQLSDGAVRYTFTVCVDEILKGHPPKTIEIVQETRDFDKRFDQWAEQHTAFLWFVGDPTWSNLGGRGLQSNAPFCSTIRLGEPVAGERIYGGDPPVIADFLPVIDPKEILARTRKLAKQRTSSTNVFTFQYIPQKPLENPWASLAVPATPALEKLGREMIADPEPFIRSTDSPATREWMRSQWRGTGVDALRYFKSTRNIRLLQLLLNDPQFYLSGPDYAATRQYIVRSHAYEILKSWGIDVPKPVVEEPAPTTGGTDNQ